MMTNLAEHFGLRTREELNAWITLTGQKSSKKIHTKLHHAKAQDASDPLHAARSQEVTSLYRLKVVKSI